VQQEIERTPSLARLRMMTHQQKLRIKKKRSWQEALQGDALPSEGKRILRTYVSESREMSKNELHTFGGKVIKEDSDEGERSSGAKRIFIPWTKTTQKPVLGDTKEGEPA